MAELSNEMKQELVNEFRRDCDRCLQETTFSWSADSMTSILDYQRLERLVYITEQMRLKLKMLGAPRINW